MPESKSATLSMEVLLSEDDWAEHLRDETLLGLQQDPPSTPPVWFYDAVGSDLFDQITGLEEYYPTRAERAILAEFGNEIAGLSQANSLIELGRVRRIRLGSYCRRSPTAERCSATCRSTAVRRPSSMPANA